MFDCALSKRTHNAIDLVISAVPHRASRTSPYPLSLAMQSQLAGPLGLVCEAVHFVYLGLTCVMTFGQGSSIQGRALGCCCCFCSEAGTFGEPGAD